MDTCSVAVALPTCPKLGWDVNVLSTEPQKLGATYPKQKPHRHAGGVSSKRRESGLVQREYGLGICKRKAASDVSVKSFWEGSDQLLHHIVEDLSSWDVGGTLSQIGYTIAPAIEATSGTMSQIGSTIAPALEATSGTLSQIGSTIAPALEATSGTLSQIGYTIGPAIEATSDVQKLELLGLMGVGWLYITASPGVLFGAVDTFFVAPLQLVLDALRGRRSWNSTDFIVGDRMGEGSFGTVYNGALLSRTLKSAALVGKRSQKIEELKGGAKFEKVVLKKVKGKVEGAVECAEMEEWFNSRVSRAAADACAVYLGSFVADRTRGQFVEGGKWLVWKYEGDMTLATYMKQANFPTNLEPFLFGSKGLAGESNPVRRRGILIQKVLRQLLTSVKKVHAIGIVHRDIKPANLVVTQSGKLKIIDFGAAIDLRTGKNFNPERGMLDPDYCPPELFVMPEETPRPPAAPVAAILSPLLYILNSPDRFDTYSVGVILLQLACSTLRTPIGLQTFKTEIAAVNYNLDKWRKKTKMKVNFDVLDQDGGKAWDLARKLVCKRSIFRRGRLSAAAALRHPYFLFGRDEFASLRARILP